jgi:two-component system, cell cycle response regulator DivK
MVEPKVLIIEDNRFNMLLVSELLTLDGFRVVEAVTAEQGLELAHTANPDIILMDISLPGVDGLTATEWLKQSPDTAGIPIVAMTAHAMRGDREKALAAGCSGYISKPIEVASFTDTVRSHFAEAH